MATDAMPYRVLDLTGELGVFCGKVLADLGADVIKVERPGGDPSRNIGPFLGSKSDPEKSLFWFAFNTSKRGITLNLETEVGQQLFRSLIALADVVIESFPPGYLDALGLGYSTLAEVNPAVILTSITPFGQDGPRAKWKSSDIVLMAMGGQMFTSGDPDRPPVRISIPQAHLHAGLHAAAGTMMALYHRQLTGEGQHIDVSAQEAVCRLLITQPIRWAFDKVLEGRMGQCGDDWRGGYVRQLWRCKDGMVAFRIVGGRQARHIKPLVEWMAQEGMSGGLERLDWDNLDLYQFDSIREMEDIFGRFFLHHTKDKLAREAVHRHILLGPVNSPKEVVGDEQLKARNFWVEVEHPDLGSTFTYPGAPFKLSLSPWRIWARAPLIGEHNEEVYGRLLGLSREEISMLEEKNVI